MGILTKQEFYKLSKQRSNQFFIIGSILLQFVVALYALKYYKFLSFKEAFTNNYFAYIPTIFFFIAICSTTITNERQYGTLKSLLYRKFSYNQVLLSKIFTLFSYMFLTYLLNSIISLLLKFTLFNKFNLTQSILKSWLLTNFSQFLTLIFLSSLVLLLGTILHSSNLAITLGIIGYFVVNIFNQLLLYLIANYTWLKWSPFNMLNLGDQLQNNRLYQVTKLTLQELSFGYVLYVLLFLLLTFYAFRKHSV